MISTKSFKLSKHILQPAKPKSMPTLDVPKIIITPAPVNIQDIVEIKSRLRIAYKLFHEKCALASQFGHIKQLKYTLSRSIISSATNILEILNINLEQLTHSTIPGFKVVPISKIEEYADLLSILIPQILEIPTSFLLKLNLGTLRFCD